MDFSLFYFSAYGEAGDTDPYRILVEGARFADSHEFAAVWTPERHFHAFGGTYPNPAVTSAHVAGLTERVAIRAGSVVAPLHHPVRIAEDWAMIDNLSGGRAGVSFASGWHPIDFLLSRVPFAERKSATLEIMESVRNLWRGGKYEGPTADGCSAVQIYPKPLRSDLPVWLTTGGSEDTYRAAAAARAGVLTHLLHQDVEELAANVAQYRAACAATGSGYRGHVVVMVHTYLADTRDEALAAVRDPLRTYLRSSLELVGRSLDAFPANFDIRSLRAADVDFLVDRALDRFVDQRGLFGTVRDTSLVERLAAAGVDEIACLVDFGVPTDLALDGLRHIDVLRREYACPSPGCA